MKTTGDISALVGKVDIRKLEHAQNDPGCVWLPGALCRALTSGIMAEFVEMFKAPSWRAATPC